MKSINLIHSLLLAILSLSHNCALARRRLLHSPDAGERLAEKIRRKKRIEAATGRILSSVVWSL
jgi:hypothetical protein